MHLSNIVEDDGSPITVCDHGALIGSIIEATELRSVSYSVLENYGMLHDVIVSYEKESKSQLEILPKSKLNLSLLRKQTLSSFLVFYDKHTNNSIKVLEGTSKENRTRSLRGMMKLNNLPDAVFNRLLLLNTNGCIKVSSSHLK